MPVTNIECQIARGQIGRYLAGDRFSAEAVAQLESHISECPGCKAFLSDRKTALQAMMGGTPSPRAVIEVPVESEAGAYPKAAEPKPAGGAPKNVTATKASNVSAASFTKPAMYALALAGVLVAMNMMAKAGPIFLGPKASSGTVLTNLTPTAPTGATPAAATPAAGGPLPPQMTTPTTSSASVAVDLVPSDPTTFGNGAPRGEEKIQESAPGAESVSDAHSEEPPAISPGNEPEKTLTAAENAKPVQQRAQVKPKVPVPETKVTSRRVRSHRVRRVARRATASRPVHHAPRHSGNSIRVYDAQGNPVQ